MESLILFSYVQKENKKIVQIEKYLEEKEIFFVKYAKENQICILEIISKDTYIENYKI